jgi:hypothetical protein
VSNTVNGMKSMIYLPDPKVFTFTMLCIGKYVSFQGYQKSFMWFALVLRVPKSGGLPFNIVKIYHLTFKCQIYDHEIWLFIDTPFFLHIVRQNPNFYFNKLKNIPYSLQVVKL